MNVILFRWYRVSQGYTVMISNFVFFALQSTWKVFFARIIARRSQHPKILWFSTFFALIKVEDINRIISGWNERDRGSLGNEESSRELLTWRGARTTLKEMTSTARYMLKSWNHHVDSLSFILNARIGSIDRTVRKSKRYEHLQLTISVILSKESRIVRIKKRFFL